MHIIPKILQNTLRLIFNENPIDFNLQFDITGEIHEAHALVFDLPEQAQKLIFGTEPKKIKNDIVALQNLLPLLLPLSIVEALPSMKEAFKEIIDQINKEIQEEGIEKHLLFSKAKENSLAYYILSSFQQTEIYPEDFHKVWKSTIELIENLEGNIKSDPLGYLGFYYPQFGFKILPLFIPFIENSNMRRIAYENLKNYTSEDCKNYLLRAFQKEQNQESCGGILKALSEQKLKEDRIQDLLVGYYYSGVELGEDAKKNLMDALKQFPNEKTFTVGLEIIKENKRYSSEGSAGILLSMGYSPKEIADIMLPHLFASDPVRSEAAFSIFCNNAKLGEFLPKPERLLSIYVNTLKKNQNLNIAYSMPTLLKKNHTNDTLKKLVDHLHHENPNVLEGILILISSSLYENGINQKFFTSKKAKERYLELIHHETPKVAENAISIVKKIGRSEGRRDSIAHLLGIIDFTKPNILVNLYAMRAINEILHNVDYVSDIKKKYLKAIESDNYNFRVAALEGFRFSSDYHFKKSLFYLKDDPSKDVQKAAEDLNKTPEKDLRLSPFLKVVRYLYIQYKYGGKMPSQNKLLMEYIQEESAKISKEQKEKTNKYLLE